MTDLTHNCAGMPRRDFLQLGIGAVLGLGFSDILRLRANAAASQAVSKPAGKQVNCIMIWLDGGPSHYETFDPKPDRKSTRLNSSHLVISYAVFCLKKKKKSGNIRLLHILTLMLSTILM